MQADLNYIPGSMARVGRDMKCPNCGNEIHPGEAYCGQCGTPVVPPVPSTNQTEMMSTPSPNGGLFNSYPAQPSAQASFAPPSQSAQIPQKSYGTRPFPANTRPISPQTGSFNPQQQGDFYQDATEAISLPNVPQQGHAPGNYTGQQNFPTTPPNRYPTVGSGPTQYGGQSGQYGFTDQQGFQGAQIQQSPQTPPFQPHGITRPVPPSSQRQPGTTGIVIISILLALALIAIIGFGTLYFVRNRTANQHSGQNAAVLAATATASANNANATATGTANANATSTATAAATPTIAPTATTAPSPTPTIVPTATPDANFTYCGQMCAANGYQTEYPTGWSQSGDSLSIKFANPAQADEYVTFRTPQTAANSASDVVANDLQTYYANQPDYTLLPQTASVTISGETWIESIATYQGATQKERIDVFGTIHTGKSYVIELQAADAQFDQVNSQYFVNVTGRFQFQQ